MSDDNFGGDILKDTKLRKPRNPDTELHLDGEKDTLYKDGMEIEDESETLADTRNEAHRG